MNNKLSRWMGIGIVLFYGRYYMSLPFKSRMTVVIGRPIEVERQSEGVEEEAVEKYLNRFIGEMVRMYEAHKVEAGYGETELIVL